MISVIIPCYNYGHLVGDSIQSVLDQTYRDIEVIVISDGSTDQTEEVVTKIRKTDSRVSCYAYPNTGLGASRNRGLILAKGEFIQFLDADDLLERKKFEEQILLFEANPEADVVYGSVRYFTKEPYNPEDRLYTYWGVKKEWMPKLNGPGLNFLPKALSGNFAHLSSPLFRKSAVDKVGLFDNEISAVADYHFLLRSAAANLIFLYHDTPETYSLVRWHPDNMSKDPNYMRREEIKMREKLRPILAANTPATESNEYAMNGLSIQVSGNWRKYFMSGGPFDFLKKGLKRAGLDKALRKLFFKKSS